MTVSDLYKRLQDTNGRRESKRNSTKDSNSPLRNTPTQGAGKAPPDDKPDRIRTDSAPGQSENTPARDPDPAMDQATDQATELGTDHGAEHGPESSPGQPSHNSPTVNDEPRRQQMLKVLRASEARHKQKIQRDAVIGIGDQVIILSGSYANSRATISDLDYIHSLALVELEGSAEPHWLNLNSLAKVD